MQIDGNGTVRRTDALGIREAISLVDSLLASVGAERIEVVTATRNRVCVQPRDLRDGEEIARRLGCDAPLDHHLVVPGYTLWTGSRDGLEVQIRSSLREPARRAW
jgi:hypothetical protein